MIDHDNYNFEEKLLEGVSINSKLKVKFFIKLRTLNQKLEKK